jgi:predicted dehydrogenase
MMRGKLRLGLVGAGAIARTHVQAVERCESAEIVAVADVRTEQASALAAEIGCAAFDSHGAMDAVADLDAVIVCTPPASHPEVCLHFIGRGVHVLCEKPLSIDVQGARRMLGAARDAGVLLTMASKFRYADDVIRAKAIVASGILGEIALFENAFTSRVDMSTRWNSNPQLSGGGVLIDNGTHSVDLMRYFLGPLAEIQVWEGKRSQGLDVEETVRIFVRSQSGILGSIDLSWTIDKELESYLNIYGSKGAVSLGWRQSRYRQSSGREWVVFGSGYDKLQAFRSQIANFCAAIRGTEPLVTTSEDALASVEVVETAYAALRENHWKPVNGAARAAAKPVRLQGIERLARTAGSAS